MKMTIDIPKDSYEATCNGSMLPPDVENVVNAIKNGTLIQVHNISGIIETLEKILICKDNCDESCAIYNSHKGVCNNDIAIKEAIKILKEVDTDARSCSN